MKNDYEIRGNVTAIFLKRKEGEIFETLIDTEDLIKAQELKGSWCAAKWHNDFYCTGHTEQVNNLRKTISLHRWFMDVPKGLYIDHFNHNTLDNRKSNLRVVTHAQNMQNKIIRKDTKSNVIGVFPRDDYWECRIRHGGKNHYLGSFKSKEEAEKIIENNRAENMPFSKAYQEKYLIPKLLEEIS